jgi:hypothetical protein
MWRFRHKSHPELHGSSSGPNPSARPTPTQAMSVLACDFLTVETTFIQRIYVLFFISPATPRIEYVACTSRPDSRWVAQQARNLVMSLGDEHAFRFLVRDRDAKLSHAFDEVFRSEGIKVIRTPGPGAERERPRRTLGPHNPSRLPRPDPHPRPRPPRTRAPHLPPPLQPAQAAPRARAATARQPRPNSAEHDSPRTPPGAPRRTHPRIRGRLNLRTPCVRQQDDRSSEP